jgi:hypothetical protein
MESFKKRIICHAFQLGACELNYACAYSHAVLPKVKGECEYGRVCSERHNERDCEYFLKNFECPKGVNCDYIHNWSLKFKEENNEEFKKNLLELNSDLEALSDYQMQLAKHTSLDMLFIVDCTGSMGTWISACKEELKVIINNLKNDFPHTKIRGAFVGK